MQRKMRTQFLADAMPHLRIQSPSVQQHKMAISRTLGLPPDVIHQLLFSFSLKGCIYANSTGIVLAMPNAPDVRALGDLLSLYAGNAPTCQPMPPMWTPCRSYRHSLWALPAKTAAMAAAGHRQRLCSAVKK